LDDSALAISSVNTIVNAEGHLRAHNTDYVAVVNLLLDHGVSPDLTFAVRGARAEPSRLRW
jgi:shikimate dehydrogenase